MIYTRQRYIVKVNRFSAVSISLNSLLEANIYPGMGYNTKYRVRYKIHATVKNIGQMSNLVEIYCIRRLMQHLRCRD